MKKIIIVAFAALCCFACKKNAGMVENSVITATIIPESAVPAAILTGFNLSFSSSTEREWHHTSDDRFVCQFNINNQRREADFDENGNKSDDHVISLNTLVPSAILNAFSTNFPSDIADEWTLTGGGWKAEFLRGNVKWEATFDSNGDLIKSEHS